MIDETDLNARLRHPLWVHSGDGEPYLDPEAAIKDMTEAADKIERLRAQVADLTRLAGCVAVATAVDLPVKTLDDIKLEAKRQ
jgi:hypothetical protein